MRKIFLKYIDRLQSQFFGVQTKAIVFVNYEDVFVKNFTNIDNSTEKVNTMFLHNYWVKWAITRIILI